MLGNRELLTGLQLQTGGGFTDVAAVVGYFNQANRWNWGGVVQQIPYTLRAYALYDTLLNGTQAIAEEEFSIRQTNRDATVILSYPFNRFHRMEFTGGLSTSPLTVSSTREFLTLFRDSFCRARTGLTCAERYWHRAASAALVFDNAIYGATSPLLGQRYRAQIQPMFGTIDMYTILADYRKYFMPIRPFTLAFRALHYGGTGRG